MRMGFSKKKIRVLQKVRDDLNKNSIAWVLVKEMRMGFSIAGAVLKKWLAVRYQKKTIHLLQKAIEQLNKALEIVSKTEKEYLEEAAREREIAAEYGERYGLAHLQMMKMHEKEASFYASLRRLTLDELLLDEALQKTAIEALEDGDFGTQKTSQSCFFL